MPTPVPRALALRTTGVTYGSADQIRVVRADLRALLDDCPMADDVLVCASELATNAVLHSRSRLAGRTFTVRGKVRPGDYFWLEVEDEGGPWTPAVADPERGHGLDIIAAWPTTGASKAITTAGPSGPASTGRPVTASTRPPLRTATSRLGARLAPSLPPPPPAAVLPDPVTRSDTTS